MSMHSPTLPAWSTAAFGNAAHTSPMELDALGEHMQQCSHGRSRLFALQCRADALHRGLLARFVTSLVLVALLAGAAAMVG